jgi:hypothetical protein
MSAVISDAAFEHEMWCLRMGLGELRTYGEWHKEDPTMPLIEMIRYMTKIREEAEVEATKRAMEDWAWEEEEAIRLEEDKKGWISCAHCAAVQPWDVCDVCHSTLARFKALSCATCAASYTGYMTADWAIPCVNCHPRYIEEYRYAEEQRARAAVAEAAWSAATAEEEMAWYAAPLEIVSAENE